MSPWISLGCESFSDFPCFWWPWQLWKVLVRYFVDCPSTGIWCFSHDQTGIMHFREEDHKYQVAFLSHHIKDTYSHPDITVDVDLDHLVEGEFINFLHCYSFPTPFHTVLFENKSLCLRSRRLCSPSFMVEFLHKLFGVLLHGKFIYSPHLFLSLVIICISMNSCIFISYFGL